MFAVAVALIPGCGAPRLRVMTYNIHIGQGMDDRFDLPRIARVINDATPDIVALQEVDRFAQRSGRIDQAGELARLTGMHVVHADTGALKPRDAQGEYGVAILSRHPIEDVRREPLPHDASRELRAALGGIVQIKGIGPVLIISTHLQHNSAEDRLAQANRINELFSAWKGPAILAGDLNAVPDSQPLQALGQHWTDAAGPQSPMTCPADRPNARIDYILYRPAGSWRVIECTVVDELVASDHRPVVAELKLQPRSR